MSMQAACSHRPYPVPATMIRQMVIRDRVAAACAGELGIPGSGSTVPRQRQHPPAGHGYPGLSLGRVEAAITISADN